MLLQDGNDHEVVVWMTVVSLDDNADHNLFGKVWDDFYGMKGTKMIG